MRTVRLICVAASAEALRWRRLTRQTGFRAINLAIGAAFAATGLVLAHVAAGAWIYTRYGGMRAAAWVGVFDLAMAILFLWLAFRRRVDPIAAEALALRRQATAELGATTARAAVIARVTAMVCEFLRSRRR